MKSFWSALLLLGLWTVSSPAQVLPKTADIHEEIAPDGSVNMNFQMTFDAAPWRQWKAMVGDEPARLRAMMRHQFAVMTLENFKLERDDMNRVAKMSMHSQVGPEIRDDGSYQMPVDGYFRLVNGADRVWFFSGNNPSAGYTLNNVKVTLPPNVAKAYLENEGKADQALVFALTPTSSPSRWFYLAGGVVSLLGLVLLAVALLRRNPANGTLVPAAAPPQGVGRSTATVSTVLEAASSVQPPPIIIPPSTPPPSLNSPNNEAVNKPN